MCGTGRVLIRCAPTGGGLWCLQQPGRKEGYPVNLAGVPLPSGTVLRCPAVAAVLPRLRRPHGRPAPVGQSRWRAFGGSWQELNVAAGRSFEPYFPARCAYSRSAIILARARQQQFAAMPARSRAAAEFRLRSPYLLALAFGDAVVAGRAALPPGPARMLTRRGDHQAGSGGQLTKNAPGAGRFRFSMIQTRAKPSINAQSLSSRQCSVPLIFPDTLPTSTAVPANGIDWKAV